jgi:hypothetical protein
VAVGSAVYVYDTTKGQGGSYVQVEDCTGLVDDAVHLDWSADSRCVSPGCYGMHSLPGCTMLTIHVSLVRALVR